LLMASHTILFLVALVLCLSGTAIARKQNRGFPFSDPQGFEFGIRAEKNFFRNTSAPLDNVDVAAAMNAYAQQWCSSGGTSVDEYGTGPFCSNGCSKCNCNAQSDGSYTWCGYPYNCVGYDWGEFDLQYGQADEQPGTPFEMSETFNNSLSVPQSFTFTKSASYANSYSWTFSTTVSDSMSVEVSASIPDVCSVKDTFSTSISVTSSQTQSFTNTNTWSVSQTFTVPANTAVRATMTITTASFNVPYTSQIRFQGYGYSWCDSQVQGHWCWFTAPSAWLNSGGCYSSDGLDAICPFAGNFYGVQGVDASVAIVPI